MKLVGVISTAVLSLTLGAAAPAYAQQEQHEQQQEGQKEKPAQPQEKRAQQQDRVNKHEEQNAQRGKSEQKEEHHEQQAQRGNGRGRISEEHFRSHFGREHVFVINRPVIIEGHPRFQYGGYWFGFGEQWPMGWTYADNVYVDYVDGGYYLYNPVHPGIRIVVNVF